MRIYYVPSPSQNSTDTVYSNPHLELTSHKVTLRSSESSVSPKISRLRTEGIGIQNRMCRKLCVWKMGVEAHTFDPGT